VATLAWTQDTVGLLATDVGACRAFYDVLTDTPAAAPPAQRLRLGVDRAAIAAAEPGVARACAQALEALAREGVELVDASLPDPALAGSVAAVVLYAEAAAAWQVELEAQPEGFSPVARAALRAGAGVSASDYLRAKRARALVCARVRAEFERLAITAVAMPTVPVTAAPAGARTVESGGRRRPIDAVHSRFTALASVTGQPALSVPCGLGEEGLPVGLQLVGPPHSERMLLDLAAAVERTDGGALVAAAKSTVARTSSFV
jgi:Asp-tRNA(Asn)/Glu-tRNA(Gln) amidotransferase A subunit family amidase